MKKLLKHKPTDTVLELDSSEVFPGDPGNGTPAMVIYRGGFASFTLASEAGVVFSEENGDIELPRGAMDWLNSESVGAEIEKMYASGHKGVW
jgi:hypothetical protein